MDRADKAKYLFKNGYNCAQAVACAFCDLTGMDEDTAYTLASSFGGGLGRLREVCGAVSGMAMVAGLLYGYTKNDEASKKAEHYKLIQTLANKFKEQTGGVVCRELLNSKDTTPTPEKRTDQYYQKRPCAEIVYLAAKIMQEYIDENENNI